MKKSILLTALLGILVVGCSSTELQESQPLNPPQPELQSMQADDNEGTAYTSPDLNLLELRGNPLLAKIKEEFTLTLISTWLSKSIWKLFKHMLNT